MLPKTLPPPSLSIRIAPPPLRLATRYLTVYVPAEGTLIRYPIQSPASWRHVVSHQQERGAAVAGDAAAAARELDGLRDVLAGRDGPRWYVTRTWWYAALVLAALGTEWILRRARRLP